MSCCIAATSSAPCGSIPRSSGFAVSDVYPDEMVPGGMVFMRCGSDHHGVGFVGVMPEQSQHIELNHIAFEVATLDEVLRARDHLQRHGVALDFEGRRRAGSQISVEFDDPDGHRLEIFWGLDKVGSDGRIRPAAEWKWAHSLEDAVADPCAGQDTTLADPSLLRRRSDDEKRRNLEHLHQDPGGEARPILTRAVPAVVVTVMVGSRHGDQADRRSIQPRRPRASPR